MVTMANIISNVCIANHGYGAVYCMLLWQMYHVMIENHTGVVTLRQARAFCIP